MVRCGSITTLAIIGMLGSSLYNVQVGTSNLREQQREVSHHTNVKANEKDIGTSDPNIRGTPSGHMFVDIQKKMFQNAVASEQPQLRRSFALGEWQHQTNGGLNDDDRLLLGSLYHNASSVFEFGLGESTRIAAHVGVPRYAGVDSDAIWVQKAREDSNMEHFRFMLADIGATGRWGAPKNAALKKIAYNYQIKPLAGEMEAFDIYLVDGRYRVACACTSFLHAIHKGADMTKIMVAIHDYNSTTPSPLGGPRGYEQFESLARVVHQSSRLAVFKLKKNTSESDVHDLWERTCNDAA